MADFMDTFAGQHGSQGEWRFDLAKRFNGAFGGTNGGVLSAISVYVARNSSGRRPASIDSRYIRGLRPGVARIVATTLNHGRTLTIVGIDIFDADNRLCTHSVATLVEQNALAQDIALTGHVLPSEHLMAWEDGKRWREPKGQEIPLIETFEPTALGGKDHETTTATRVVWQQRETSAEAACIAADISVGPPVARAVRGAASTPNPDLSLRFCGTSEPDHHLIASCELQAIVGGLASTRIAVWNGSDLLAIGVSTTTCIPIERQSKPT